MQNDVATETLIGIIESFSTKKLPGGLQRQILVKNIKKFGEHSIVSLQQWFTINNNFIDSNSMERGSVLIFDAQLKRNRSSSTYQVSQPINMRLG